MESPLLQERMHKVTCESLESTRNMLQMAAASEETGIATLTALYAQDEQLSRIEGHVDHANSDLRQAEESVERMRSCCCLMPWRKMKIAKRDKAYGKTTWSNKHGHEKATMNPTKQHWSVSGERYSGTCDGYITRITHDDREVDMEKNLADVGHMVANLRGIAAGMNNQLASDSPKIDRIVAKVTYTDDRVDKVNRKCNKLL